MNNEEKILEMLTQMNTHMDQMQETQTRMQETQTRMQDDIHRINVRLDLDVGKRLDALAEGQDTIEQRLDTIGGELHEARDLAEETRDKVDVIHAAVAQHSAAITELKKVR